MKQDYIQSAVLTLWYLFYALSSFRSDGSALVAINYSSLKFIRDIINPNSLLRQQEKKRERETAL